MRKLLLAAGLTLVAAGAVALVGRAGAGADGPQPIAWDRAACAHCHMLIGEPAFAAQAIDTDGQVLDFDDPGCLLAWLDGQASAPRALWFHHHDDERWLSGPRAGFLPVEHSPMGWRLAAVDAGSAGALSLAEARARVIRPPEEAQP